MGSEDDAGDLGTGEWKAQWTLRGWGVEATGEA